MDWFSQLADAVYNYFTDEDMWQTFLDRGLTILFIIIGTLIVVRIGKTILHNVFKMRTTSRLRLSEKRETTLEKLVENVFTYVVYFVSFLMILDQFVDVKALIAGAGIAGLAIGFGAQNLVRDIISGFFIIFEEQFSVGDYIKTGNFEGTVEEIGLRTTKITSWTGELHILPNGSVTEVTNFSINNNLAVVDIRVAYEEDIAAAEAIIQEVTDELSKKLPEMVRPPEVLGVEVLGASEVIIRVIAEVLPMEHWMIGREIRKAVKHRFEQKGIEIPYPRLVTYRNEKSEEPRKDEMSDDEPGQ